MEHRAQKAGDLGALFLVAIRRLILPPPRHVDVHSYG